MSSDLKFPPVDLGMVDRHDAHTVLAHPQYMAMINEGVKSAFVPRLLIKLGLLKPEDYQAAREETMLTVAAIVANHAMYTDPSVAAGMTQQDVMDLMSQDVATYITGGVDPDDVARLYPDRTEAEGDLN